MPELPEVEVVRRGLESQRSSSQLFRITKVTAERADIRFPLPRESFKKARGLSIHSFDRIAKFLLFRTEKGTWLSHLGMTGFWRFETSKNIQKQKHDHLIFEFENGQSLIYNDPRRFGFVSWIPLGSEGKNPFLQRVGLDPTKVSFKELQQSLWPKFKSSSSTLHGLLLNQKLIAGIGNIYASEILLRAGVRPTRRGQSLKALEFERILKETLLVLEAAIASGGSTISSYKSIDGEGFYQKNHKVYGREGEKCHKCSGVVFAKTLAGRTSYFCKVCQK